MNDCAAGVTICSVGRPLRERGESSGSFGQANQVHIEVPYAPANQKGSHSWHKRMK